MERWIIDRQELDGCWGGIQPPWVWSLIALACRGHGPDSPYLRRGLAGWERFMVEDGDRLRPEACQSPVWDTGLALLGLARAGRAGRDTRGRRAVDWILGEEVRARGDWAVRLPGVAPGGWSFEYDNDLYPDVDDVAVVALALRRARRRPGRRSSGRAAGSPAMQSANGGWGAFDVDNDAYWLYDLPFCDFGAVIDPPSVDVTAHVVELLAGEPGYEDAVAPGRRVPAARAGAGRLLVRAAGASTTSTEPAPRCPRSRRRASRRPPGDASRRRLARRAPERRTAASARTAARTTPARRASPGAGEAPRPPSQTAWGLIGARRGRRGPLRSGAPRAAALALRDASARTATGTRSTSPAPASRATS